MAVAFGIYSLLAFVGAAALEDLGYPLLSVTGMLLSLAASVLAAYSRALG